MNIYRIALFIFLFNASIAIFSAGNGFMPIKCDASGYNCIYFSYKTMQNTELSDVLSEKITENEYKSTQIENDVTADTWTSLTTSLDIVTTLISSMIIGTYYMITFIFGNSLVMQTIGVIMNTTVLFIYGVAILKMIRGEPSGEI